MTNKQILFGASLAVLAGLGATPVASAQDAVPPAASDIIVTAQFKSQKLQDTPLAITALNARGKVLLPAIRGALQSLPAVASLSPDGDTALGGTARKCESSAPAA